MKVSLLYINLVFRLFSKMVALAWMPPNEVRKYKIIYLILIIYIKYSKKKKKNLKVNFV